jgi:hypothetical protein
MIRVKFFVHFEPHPLPHVNQLHSPPPPISMLKKPRLPQIVLENLSWCYIIIPPCPPPHWSAVIKNVKQLTKIFFM